MPFRRGIGTSDLASQGGLCQIDGLRHGDIAGIGARARPSDPAAVDDPRDSTGGVPVRGDLRGQCGIRAICVVISHDRYAGAVLHRGRYIRRGGVLMRDHGRDAGERGRDVVLRWRSVVRARPRFWSSVNLTGN